MGTKKQLLGDYSFAYESFLLDELFLEFHTPAYKKLSVRKKFKAINKALLDFIQKAKEPCFLLPATLEFIDRVNQEKLFHEPYRFSSFEFWLNRFSHLSEEENLKIRAKIVGKWIPRSVYQTFFPIGMDKTFSGTHFVAAHASPDIDTTIASFWGWIDAFGAKVSEGVHLWSLPGTFHESHFTFLFQRLFSPTVFDLARTVPTLTLTALDLVTQENITRVPENAIASQIEHNHANQAVLLVDDDEHYKGDWRASDAEAVGNIMILFNNVMRFFINTIHTKLIATFAKPSIHIKDVSKALDPIFDELIKDCEPAKDFNEKQKKQLNDYLKKVLLVEKGITASFLELGSAIDRVTDKKFSTFYSSVQSIKSPELYDKAEKLIEDRPKIFSRLEKIINDLGHVIYDLRSHIERLASLMEVKEKVLGSGAQYVTLKSDVEEVKSKMNGLDYLTVVIPEENGKLFPVGVIHDHDLRRPVLGTVSLRDFSNEQETKMASYLEVISVIDHHKTELKTLSAPCFLIADVQSSNTLVASLQFKINERYSLLGLSRSEIDTKIAEHFTKKQSDHKPRENELKKLARLLQLKLNTTNEMGYFVHPQREYAEYLCYLYAILDDTDLLTKVSDRDVECVATLLNRMKSLSSGEDVEIISLDAIPRDAHFAKVASALILQNPDMYSIYQRIYEYKEQEMEANLANCIAGKPSTVFADTKEQNGCCRVGQTKIFNTNYSFFSKHADALRTLWLKDAKKVFENKNLIDFHLHMISTVAGAEEVYTAAVGDWQHQDEMWFWIPPTELARERLIDFLIAFSPTPAVQENEMEVEFLGPNAIELNQIFEQNLTSAKRKPFGEKPPQGHPIAVLRYKAGSINSRKAQISPYLPRFVP